MNRFTFILIPQVLSLKAGDLRVDGSGEVLVERARRLLGELHCNKSVR